MLSVGGLEARNPECLPKAVGVVVQDGHSATAVPGKQNVGSDPEACTSSPCGTNSTGRHGPRLAEQNLIITIPAAMRSCATPSGGWWGVCVALGVLEVRDNGIKKG